MANRDIYTALITPKNLLIQPAQKHAEILTKKSRNQAEPIAVLILETYSAHLG